MLAKKGIVFPNVENLGPFPVAIAYALKSELGSTHQAVKTIRRWTGAGERTVKNWLAGISGPSGQHLADLIRHSDVRLNRRNPGQRQRLPQCNKGLDSVINRRFGPRTLPHSPRIS